MKIGILLKLLLSFSITLCFLFGMQITSCAAEQIENRGIRLFQRKKTPTQLQKQLPYNKIWAVIIGINNYKSAPPLRWAVADAKAVENKLHEYGIIKKDIITLYDNTATQNALIQLFSEKLRRQTGKEDGLIIYFAGHGVTIKSRAGKEEGYLLASDSVIENVERTGISMDFLRIIFESMPPKHILFIVDACYSGFMLQRSAPISSRTANYIKKITYSRSRQIITAGGKNEQATETAGHGLFTERLLFGLEGPADVNLDGVITGLELGTYLRQEVSLISENRQTPLFGNISGEGDFVFIRPDLDRDEVDLMKQKIVFYKLYETNYFQGIRLLKERKWEQARKSFIQALSYKPDDFWAKDKLNYIDNLFLFKEAVPDRFGKSMVLVPGGIFIMGSKGQYKDEAPERTVQVKLFYIDQTEVTNEEFRRFLEAPDHRRFEHPNTPENDSFQPLFWQVPSYSSPNKPVVGISWYAAYAFSNWAGKRLPTEEEWEKAARATDGRRFVWGNQWNPNKDSCNWSKDHINFGLADIGSFPLDTSLYKVKDLSGNASEWVLGPSDGYNQKKIPMDSYGNPFVVVRGGNFKTMSHMMLRAAYRSFRHPSKGYSVVGFRCVRSPKEEDKK